jgi:hypothetical protein
VRAKEQVIFSRQYQARLAFQRWIAKFYCHKKPN